MLLKLIYVMYMLTRLSLKQENFFQKFNLANHIKFIQTTLK